MKHMSNVVVKEVPYIILLLVTLIFIIYCFDKLRQYRNKLTWNEKLESLCNQHNFTIDASARTDENLEHMLCQMDQELKKDELHISAFEYRYRTVADITNQIIFEYNLSNHTICDSLNWHALGDGNRFINETIASEIVHPEDADIFRKYFEGPFMSGQISEITIRLRPKRGEAYHDTIIRGIVLEGLNGQPEKIIGTRTILHQTENAA